MGPDLLAGCHVPRLQLADVRGALALAHRGFRPLDPEVELARLVRVRFGLAHQCAAQILVGGNVEIVGLGVVAGRRPVLAAPQAGTEGDRGTRARLAPVVVAGTPGHRVDLREDLLGDVGPGIHELDGVGTALEPPQIAVPTGMHQALDHSPVLLKVDEQRRGNLVPVPGVVPVVLVVGPDFPRVDVERDHGGRVEVVARSHVAHPRRAVAGTPEAQVELGIVVGGQPDRDAASLPRVTRPRVVAALARSRDRVRLPRRLAVVGVEGGDVAADSQLAARGTDHDLALGDERRQREVVALLVVVDGRVPYDLARFGLERDEVRVDRGDVHAIAQQRHASVGRV